MSNLDSFNQFYKQNQNYFSLFEDYPIKGLLRSVWQKKDSVSQQKINDLKCLCERMKILKGEAESKLELRQLEIKRKELINQSILDQQAFLKEEINNLEIQKTAALSNTNFVNEQLGELKIKHQDVINQLNQLDTLKVKINEMEDSNNKLIEENLNLGQLIIEKENDVKSREKEFRKQENKLRYLSTLEDAIAIQQSVFDSTTSENRELNKSIDSLKNTIEELMMNAEDYHTEIDSLKAQKQDLKAEIDQLLHQNNELDLYAKNYKKLNNKLSNEMYRLSNQVN